MTFRHIYSGPPELRLARQHIRLNYSWLNELPVEGDSAYVRGIRDCAVGQGDLMRLFPGWFPAWGHTEETPRAPWAGALEQRCAYGTICNHALLFRAIAEVYGNSPSLMCDTTGLEPLTESSLVALGRLGRLLRDGLYEGPNWVNVWCSALEMRRLALNGWHVATEFFPESDTEGKQAEKLWDTAQALPRRRFCAILNTADPDKALTYDGGGYLHPDNQVVNRLQSRHHQIVVRDLSGVEYDAAELEEKYR